MFRATLCPQRDSPSGLGRERGATEYPGTIGERMARLDLACFRRQAKSFWRDSEELGGLVEVQPRFNAVLCALIDRDAMMRAHRGDPFTGPAVSVARDEPVSVQESSDDIVAQNEDELPDRVDDVGRRAVPLTAPTTGETYLAVKAADPMNNEDDFGGLIIDIGDDLVDEGSRDPLF